MNPWFLVGSICSALYFAILLTKSLLGWRYAVHHPETEIVDGAVTVLQPILGGDPFLEEALRRNLASAPTDARFVWLIDEDDSVGRQAAANFANDQRVTITLCRPCPSGTNPKLFKLNLASPDVTSEFVAVLDDDTMLAQGHLARAMAALSTCDLYTGLPRYQTGNNAWSSLVAHFVNNNSILTYLPLLGWTGPLTINGMFYVMRTETLRACGGFESILGQLCDDYSLARLVMKNGFRIRQGVTSQVLHTSISDAGHYFRQMHRWFVFANVLVLDQSFSVKILLAVFLGLPPLFLWGSLLLLAGGWIGTLMLLAVLVLRYVVIRLLHHRIFSELPQFSPVMSMFSELLQAIHLLHACLSPVIIWRSRRIRVGRNGSFTELKSAT